MRIGAKTITALTFLAASVGAARFFGRLRPDYLAQLDPWSGLAVGAFAVLAASAVFHFGRLGQPSEHHLRFGRWGSPRVERADPFGRAPRRRSAWSRRLRAELLRLVYVAVFLFVGLLTIDNRGIALLGSVPSAFAPSKHVYCLDDESPEPVEDPRLAGCGLLRRAFELGYAKDLGPCAPKEADDVAAVCDRRQLDEPYLHYAWRLLEARGVTLLPDATAGVRATVSTLEDRSEHLGALLRTQLDSIARTPRASHHLFTNLSPPRDGTLGRLVDAVDVAACDERTVNMPHLLSPRGRPTASSLALEHVMGQLLFNPAYPTVVASCREYTIHWNAPADACDRLLDDPEALLASMAALGKVRSVVDRRQRAQLAWRLNNGASTNARRPPALERVVSFQCLMTGGRDRGGTAKIENRAAVVDGHRFSVRALVVPPFGADVRDQVRLFRGLARLFAPGFTYGKLQSAETLADTEAERSAARRFKDGGSLLTKLELLRETDIFLGHRWLDERPDLLSVYPYHVHLRNYVEAFRQHYRLSRSRL